MAAAIDADPIRIVSAVSVVEASLVLAGRSGEDSVDDLDLLLSKLGAEIVSFSPDTIAATRTAYARFGKGLHRAKLNFGDCFAYTLAVTLGEPLLYKGEDFGHTDVKSALP